MAVRISAPLLLGLLLLVHTWGARAAVDVNMEDRVEVFRGDTAQITCLFTSDEGIGGITITWLYVTRGSERREIYFQDTTMKIVDQGTPYTNRISVNGTGANGEVVLTINNVQLEDEVEFICLITSLTYGGGEGRTKLKVFEIPNPPTIEAVQTGFKVNGNLPARIGLCEVKNGYPRPNITWYRDNTPLRSNQWVTVVPSITTEFTGLFSVKSELSMTVMKEDKDAKFYCEVNYFVPGGTRMTETNRINITVHYPSTAVSVWVESPKGKIKEGDSLELYCQGNGNDPSAAFTITHNNVDHNLESNMLVLNNVTRLDSGVYHCTCLDTDTYEEITGNTTVLINYLDSAVVIPDDTVVLTQGDEMVVTCNALSSLPTHTVWFKDGQEISTGHTLNLKDATFSTAGTYVCAVTVPEIDGLKTSGTVSVTVRGPPEIIRPDNTDIEETFEKSVDLNCMVRGFPVPSITWTTSDEQDLKTTSQHETEDGVKSVVSVKVTSDITVFCNASNEYGTDALTFTIKATIHKTTQAITTTSTISSTTVKAQTSIPPKKIKKEGSGVIIAVIIICILLLAILGSVLYFLYKKGKICGRSGKQDLSKEKSSKDNIVVEMKSDNTEEAILLGVNGEKQPPNDQ